MSRFSSHSQSVMSYDGTICLNHYNPFSRPKLEKVVLNLGLKDIVSNKKLILSALLALEMVSGQRTVTTKSRKPQIALKVRKGMVTGAKVVLRQFLKYNFLDKFLTVTLPRIKEFTGFKKIMVTTSGNFSFRIQEPLNFMELEYEYNKFTTLPSMDVTLVTSVENKIKSLCVLASLGVPFLKKNRL